MRGLNKIFFFSLNDQTWIIVKVWIKDQRSQEMSALVDKPTIHLLGLEGREKSMLVKSEPFLTSLADLNLTDPLGLENL